MTIRKTPMKRFAPLLVAAALAQGSVALAADMPPADALPLSEILEAVPGNIGEAEFDDGRWEVKACDGARCDKRYIDPVTGREQHRKSLRRASVPAAGSAPTALELVKRLEAADTGAISEIEFEHGRWEVKLVVPVAAP